MTRSIRIEGDVAYVPLTKGYEAIIDAADVSLVEGVRWSSRIARNRRGEIRTVYAARYVRLAGGKQVAIHLHRVIANPRYAFQVDHVDGNGLNNRRINLREATRAQNMCNQGLAAHNTSGFKGVSWDAKGGKWRATISVSGKLNRLGFFKSALEAADAYKKASCEMHGDFGRVE